VQQDLGMVEAYEPMPEDWRRALAVVAHPDDLEYGGSAAVARWTAEGRVVSYLLATRGEVGVDVVEFLGHPDGLLEYGIPLRRDIAAAIRRHRPELVITPNHHDRWAAGALNMADHVALGRSVIDAVRDAANRWIFPELGEPWAARWVAVTGSPHSSHAVEISEHFDRGVASLTAHRAYLAALAASGGPMTDPVTFLRAAAERDATRLPGARLATAFELITT
jgi:LmbE family N-acetylglucosaminyl deacetylase